MSANERGSYLKDLYDLEDCIDVLASVVQELENQSLKKSEISTVIPNQHMAKYVYMEDSILEGLETLSKSANTKQSQDQILEMTAKFNTLGYEFQENWNDDMWEIYENARDPKRRIPEAPATPRQVSRKLLDLQEIAITLSRMSRGPENNSPKNQPLQEIDKEANKFKTPSIHKEKNENRRLCCTIS